MVVTFYTMDWRALIACTFEGPRFDDGGLDLQDLDALVLLRDLLTETAKEIWYEDNPERVRQSPGYNAALRLRFYDLEKNCTTIRIKRPYEEPLGTDGTRFLIEPEPAPDDLSSKLEWAAAMLVELVHSHRIPDGFPEYLTPKAKEFAATISRPGESIKLTLLFESKARRRAVLPAPPKDAPPETLETAAHASQPSLFAVPSGGERDQPATKPAGEAATPKGTDIPDISQILVRPPSDAEDEQGFKYGQAARSVRIDPPPLSAPPPRPITPPPPRPSVAQVSSDTAAQLAQLIRQPYEDDVDLVGEVTMASLKGRATINLPKLGEKEIRFVRDQEKRVTKSLYEHETLRLRVIGRGMFDPYTNTLSVINKVYDLQIITENELIFHDQDWIDRNERRIFLIDKSLEGELTDEEQAELNLLQQEAGRIRDEVTKRQYSFLDDYDDEP